MSSPTQFPITQWTAVAELCQAENEAARHAALISICQAYWYPLYAFARRLGFNTQDAEDLTQGFFVYVIEHNPLASANRDLGRLRTFLLTVFRRYVSDERDRQQAQKRGGRAALVSFDLLDAEELYRHEPADLATPESLFERSWALQVLRSALDALSQSEIRAGRADHFEVIAPFLDPEVTASPSSAVAAQQLGLSLEAFRQALSRLRRKFRGTLRKQIAGTLRDPTEAQIDEELSALMAVLQG